MKRSKFKPTLDCRFYRSNSGDEPVREWLKELPSLVRQEIGSDIQVVQWRWPLGPPKVAGLGDGFYTQKTPRSDLELARRRQRMVENPQ